MRYVDECPLISEVVIALTLGNRWQQQKSSERREHQDKQRDHAATIFRAGEHHSGSIAEADGEVRSKLDRRRLSSVPVVSRDPPTAPHSIFPHFDLCCR